MKPGRDPLADAGYGCQLSGLTKLIDVLGQAPNDMGGSMVGADPKGRLTLDFKKLSYLIEDGGNFVIVQLSVTLMPPMPRHPAACRRKNPWPP